MRESTEAEASAAVAYPARLSPEYHAYITSPEWSRTRLRALALSDFTCRSCGAKKQLEVDHLTYRRFGHEKIRDLIVLCHDCHKLVTDARREAGVRSGYGYRRVTTETLGIIFAPHPVRTCRDPECGRVLSGGNQSGLCTRHWKTRRKARNQALKVTGKTLPVRGRRCMAPGCSNSVARKREEPFCRLHLNDEGDPVFDDGEPPMVFDLS